MNSQQTKALTDEEIDDILNKDLINLLGLQDLSEEKKKQFLDAALTAIENRTYARILSLLEKKGKVAAYKEAEDIDKFLEDEGIDTDKIYLEEALFYKLQMKSYGKVIDDGMLSQTKKTAGGTKDE